MKRAKKHVSLAAKGQNMTLRWRRQIFGRIQYYPAWHIDDYQFMLTNIALNQRISDLGREVNRRCFSVMG
ncbi:hypothetical protein D3C87_1757230 [compost metagenome]